MFVPIGKAMASTRLSVVVGMDGLSVAKNTGRHSRRGHAEESKGQFLKSKSRGGSFGKQKPWYSDILWYKSLIVCSGLVILVLALL